MSFFMFPDLAVLMLSHSVYFILLCLTPEWEQLPNSKLGPTSQRLLTLDNYNMKPIPTIQQVAKQDHVLPTSPSDIQKGVTSILPNQIQFHHTIVQDKLKWHTSSLTIKNFICDLLFLDGYFKQKVFFKFFSMSVIF